MAENMRSSVRKDPRLKKRIFMSLVGVIVCAISIGLFKRSELGIDPFQTLMSGVNAVIPIPFGTFYVIANCILLLFSLIADWHYIGLATVINLTLTGYVSQFMLDILLKLFPAGTVGLGGRVIFLLIGIVVMCFASSIYFVADLGVSTYDAVALILTNDWHVLPFKFCRILTDLVCVIVGSVCFMLAGGTWSELFKIVGIGTIITAFFMGPLIDFFTVHFSRPFLERE